MVNSHAQDEDAISDCARTNVIMLYIKFIYFIYVMFIYLFILELQLVLQ